jgi:peptidyl-prolyl cis-trans isomerase A (cyclophilin A)
MPFRPFYAAILLALAMPTGSAQSKVDLVEIKTSAGDFVVELDAKRSPITTNNFLAYVDAGHYDKAVFHRVIKDFVVQGGGYDEQIHEKSTRAPIKLEAQNGLKNTRGSLAMARTSQPDSATAQFFINVSDNTMLDYPSPDGHGYAVFGKVVSGMETIDKIQHSPTGPGDQPKAPIVIFSAKRLP